ncbi:MAG: thiamine phosphate synthase [Calditerrivibrio sp.]|nr:thiamine phosphate synthase [Calditerrivibrio sp.]
MKILFILDYDTYKSNLINTFIKSVQYSDIIWFRVKKIDTKEMFNIMINLRKLAPEAKLIVSERADLAKMAGFNGVHLGAHSTPPEVIKKKFPELLIGYSAHSLKEIKENEADYFTLSPIFWTKKEYNVTPIGAIDISDYKKKIFALGGINKHNVCQLRGKGFYGIAGISFINDIEELPNLVR